MLEIVKMQKEHIKDILEIENECFFDPWSEKMLTDELNSGISHYFVAEDSGVVCGYVGMYVTVDIANITNIAVKKEYRRRAVADSLLSMLINEAKSQKLSFVTLEVRESNVPAISLYSKHKFKIEGKRKAYYSDNHEDALIMTLDITEDT